METFHMLRSMERKFYADLALALPAHKSAFEHRDMLFIFYAPKAATVARYLAAADVCHSDMTVLGKLHIGGRKLLLVHMDLFYYGLSRAGAMYRLGRSIARLSLDSRKVYAHISAESA